MTDEKLNEAYFEWMTDLVRNRKTSSYSKLLKYLHEKEFTYIIEMDDNRAGDGVDFRYRFGYENGYSDVEIAKYIDNKPCSILEMMVALAFRIEEHIMSNPDIGDRTGKWFWGMIENMGLKTMTDATFDVRYANEVVERFLNREYGRDGKGGLFTVKNCRYDLRGIEIWYQACWYLNQIT